MFLGCATRLNPLAPPLSVVLIAIGVPTLNISKEVTSPRPLTPFIFTLPLLLSVRVSPATYPLPGSNISKSACVCPLAITLL